MKRLPHDVFFILPSHLEPRTSLILVDMKRFAIDMKRFAILALALACGRPEPGTPVVSKEPISVRGWIIDVETGRESTTYKTVETEAARKAQLFQGTNIWVDNAPYVSGGVAETGAFLLLDVPPGTSTIELTPPGGTTARLRMENVPGNADVFLPAVVLRNDTAVLTDPAAVKVRLAARVARPAPSGTFVTIAGQRIPVMNTPIAQMTDRHDYPTPPGGGPVPLATVK
jgi:hypothetical protein